MGMAASQEVAEPSEPVIDPIIESGVEESTIPNGVISAAPIPLELAVESGPNRQEEEANTNLAMETEGLETSMVDKEPEGVDEEKKELETPLDKEPEGLETPLDKKPEELKPEMIHMMMDDNVGLETTPMVDEEREGLEPEMIHMMYDRDESGNALDEDTMDENDIGNALDEDTRMKAKTPGKKLMLDLILWRKRLKSP